MELILLKINLPESTDVNPNILLKNLQEAQATLERVKNDNLNVRDEKLHKMVKSAIEKADIILENIAKDPRDRLEWRESFLWYIWMV